MRRVVFDDSLDLAVVASPVLLEEVVCLSLGRRIWIWFIEEFLYAEKDLLDGNCRLPTFFLVQNR